MVRASLVFVTSIRQVKVSMQTLSIHGSARTAKLAAIRHIRSFYRSEILYLRTQAPPDTAARTTKLCTEMENRMMILQAIDY